MFILKIILGIALVLLILLFVLLCLLLFCKIGLHIKQNKYLQIWLNFWFINIKIYPQKNYTQKKQDYTDEYKPKTYENKSKSKNLDLNWYLDFAFSIIDDLKDKLYINKLHLNIVFASDDAAKTGIMLGTAFSISGMIIPVLEQNFNIKDQIIKLDADFNSKQTIFALDFIAYTRIISILLVAFKHRKQLFKLYDTIK